MESDDILPLNFIKYRTEQKAVFRFTNTGTAPLLIYLSSKGTERIYTNQ